ncbi:hypothetical protein [Qipengyuania gelatinilytica]|uniref:DUF1444 family protein n=1 Tax=Qipengyuania gelatinilytica TaxID=2867231 RepID=A0ABX8ZZP9_9SPHN|nr:hypothetical protein [Qipengyuania gelatinilytica]QZD94500.1 hypothetical protein K3136_10390 [Qipengyuania gelatinilytica]
MKSSVFLFAFPVALGVTACSASAQTEDQFAAEMRSRVTSLEGIDGAITSREDDPLELKLVDPDGNERLINLHRIWTFCQNNTAADCATVKEEFLEKITAAVPEMSRETLRLIVRDREYFRYVNSLKNPETGESPSVIYRQIGSDLFALLANDGPETIALVTQDHLEELMLSEAEAWDMAERQTADVLPKLPKADDIRNTGVAFEDFEYLGSLILDLKSWAAISDEVGEDMVMTVVSDQFVLFGTMPDGPDLASFRQTVADDCRMQQRCISPNIYRFRQGRWEAIR